MFIGTLNIDNLKGDERGDITNNDGFEDLFCTYFGHNRLYRNNGDGTFTDVTKPAGLWEESGRPRWGAGSSFVDYDRDGHLEIVFCFPARLYHGLVACVVGLFVPAR